MPIKRKIMPLKKMSVDDLKQNNNKDRSKWDALNKQFKQGANNPPVKEKVTTQEKTNKNVDGSTFNFKKTNIWKDDEATPYSSQG